MAGAEAVVRELERVWNARDVDGVGQVFAEKAVFVDMAFNVERHGLSDIRALFEETWKGLPDLHTELTRVISDGDWAATEWTLTGTHTGDFPDIPATGRSIRIRGASIVHTADGEIYRQRDYYDRTTFLDQLGVAEERR